MKPTTKFGETFQYSNLMAAAAGYIGGHVAYPKKELGAAYDEAMRTQVSRPARHEDRRRSTTGERCAGNHAAPHEDDIDGKTASRDDGPQPRHHPGRARRGRRGRNVDDMLKYVRMELAKGKLPDGKTLRVRGGAARASRAAGDGIGEDTTYGMGLEVDTEYGVAGGAPRGRLSSAYHSDMIWMPEQRSGRRHPDQRPAWAAHLLRHLPAQVCEVLYDGKPEAMEERAGHGQAHAAELSKVRERLLVPPAADVVARLAAIHERPARRRHRPHGGTGGDLRLRRVEEHGRVTKERRWHPSIITVDPGVGGFEFVVTDKGGKRALVIRDMQHEYALTEAP